MNDVMENERRTENQRCFGCLLGGTWQSGCDVSFPSTTAGEETCTPPFPRLHFSKSLGEIFQVFFNAASLIAIYGEIAFCREHFSGPSALVGSSFKDLTVKNSVMKRKPN
jgi:hypothetical protein